MAVGALNRAEVRTNLSTLLATAAGLAESDFIDLEAGPQGRAHLYWSIASISSADAGHRAGAGAVIGKRYSVVVRYAHRVNPKDRETTRDAALASLDALERSVRNSTASARASLEFTSWADSERLSGSREWMIWDISVGLFALFDLGA